MINLNDEQQLLENKHYKKYFKQKQKVKSKYDPDLWSVRVGHRKYKEGEQEQWRAYLKEVADLIFKPKGGFQNFTWDAMNSVEKLHQERRARGASQKRSTFNYY